MSDYEAKARMEQDQDAGPVQRETMELRKRIEHLFIVLDSLERKLKPVLRIVPEESAEVRGPSPRLLQSELTEVLADANTALGRMDLQIADMITRCEL